MPDIAVEPETLKTFTQRIQPILLNGCGAGACHGGSNGYSFELLTPGLRGGLTAAMTQQNLSRALKLIDRDNPEASPLLTKALDEHGGGTRLPLERGTPAYRHLEAWILKLAPPRRDASPFPPDKSQRSAEPGPSRFSTEETQTPKATEPERTAANTTAKVPMKTLPGTVVPSASARTRSPQPGAATVSPPAGPPKDPLKSGTVVGASQPDLATAPPTSVRPAKDEKDKGPVRAAHVQTSEPSRGQLLGGKPVAGSRPETSATPPAPADAFDPLPFNKRYHPDR